MTAPTPTPGAGTVPAPGAGAWAALARAARGVRWYVTTLMGDRDYECYVAHLRRAHPDAPVPTEKEFWRQRWAEQDANPGARCC
ncbi:YbdD/YjiX family protein [Georgenia thermotolerans]|uniref:Putative selenoprotein n=1 Tax=Georgenia thermotolerans TaxID=527326 RepID=A0A7J5UQ89_9MICO|nr:YbdD/YjiX family protein [Georgenia thermotolerans]KAE8764572.1 putative selenoprotein [Georgenia thermotolerans]